MWYDHMTFVWTVRIKCVIEFVIGANFSSKNVLNVHLTPPHVARRTYITFRARWDTIFTIFECVLCRASGYRFHEMYTFSPICREYLFSALFFYGGNKNDNEIYKCKTFAEIFRYIYVDFSLCAHSFDFTFIRMQSAKVYQKECWHCSHIYFMSFKIVGYFCMFV